MPPTRATRLPSEDVERPGRRDPAQAIKTIKKTFTLERLEGIVSKRLGSRSAVGDEEWRRT